jgi:hypothetical protein
MDSRGRVRSARCRRVIHRQIIVVLLSCVLLVLGGQARANQGVAVDLGLISVRQSLSPGGRYRLPTLGVTNPATDPSHYRLGVGYIDGQSQRPPPEGWFVFEPAEFTLRSHQTQPVSITLIVPVHAEPGTYAALLRAAIVPPGGGVTVGAAAAARLTFRVAESSTLRSWFRLFRRYLSEHAPASYALPSTLAFAFGLWMLRRRFSFSIRIGRRS